jgi:hypothetical protein
MGRKRAGGAANVIATKGETKLRPVRLELTDEEHRLLRLEAARQDVSLGAMAHTAVVEYLNARKDGRR